MLKRGRRLFLSERNYSYEISKLCNDFNKKLFFISKIILKKMSKQTSLGKFGFTKLVTKKVAVPSFPIFRQWKIV